MHPQVDAGEADQSGEDDRDEHDVGLDREPREEAGEDDPQGEIDDGGEHRVPAREGGSEDFGSVGDELGTRAVEPRLHDQAKPDPAEDRCGQKKSDPELALKGEKTNPGEGEEGDQPHPPPSR